MRYSIVAVDDDRDRDEVRKFIDAMPARDAMAFRQYAKDINPNIDMTFEFECSHCQYADRLEVPIDETFFWPNSRV